jgi:hypothetical protein
MVQIGLGNTTKCVVSDTAGQLLGAFGVTVSFTQYTPATPADAVVLH